MLKKVDKIWLDGKLVPWEDANVHLLTHTLHYGLGVFEGIRFYEGPGGRPFIFRLKEHVRRLFDSAHVVTLQIPYSQEEIFEACRETVRVNRLKSGYIRPLAFIGDGEMGLFATKNKIRVGIAAWEWGSYLGEEGLKNGIRTKVSSYTRHHVNATMNKAKVCGNYINSILAKREVIAAGYEEAILLDAEGYVAEASGENIFIVRDGVIRTTPSGSSILPGITADSVCQLLKEIGHSVIRERSTRDELYLADEIFLTGTAAEITPVREVDGRRIGRGEPGPITRKAQELFFGAVRGKNEKFKNWLTEVSS
ncbi:MAG: branched-chain amino acid transaminase [Deltaproteobacteria bacterium]|nr:branched-chain amino acid transaminase [Deltaproteobacteria bacterium]